MPTLDYQDAISEGHSPEDIRAYAASHPDVQITNVPKEEQMAYSGTPDLPVKETLLNHVQGLLEAGTAIPAGIGMLKGGISMAGALAEPATRRAVLRLMAPHMARAVAGGVLGSEVGSATGRGAVRGGIEGALIAALLGGYGLRGARAAETAVGAEKAAQAAPEAATTAEQAIPKGRHLVRQFLRRNPSKAVQAVPKVVGEVLPETPEPAPVASQGVAKILKAGRRVVNRSKPGPSFEKPGQLEGQLRQTHDVLNAMKARGLTPEQAIGRLRITPAEKAMLLEKFRFAGGQ